MHRVLRYARPVRIWSAGLAPLLVALAIPAPVEAQGQQQVVFPEGAWVGTAVFDGTISNQTVFGITGGGISFELVVADGQVIDGTLDMEGGAGSTVPGGGADLAVQGTFETSGTAAVVVFAGMVTFEGTARAQGFTAPVSGSAPGSGSFSPEFASCSRVIGDLATEGRKLQEAAGLATTVKADFVALRDVGAQSASLVEEYGELAEDIKDFLSAAATANGHKPPTVTELLGLVERVALLFNRIASLKSCQAVPPGLEKGLADPYFSDLFRQLMLELLARADQLKTQSLITLLYLAYDVGALGASSPDPAAADAALDQFVQVLRARIDTAYAQQDVKTLLAIYTAAQQLGLEDLAAKAAMKLGDFVDTTYGQGGGPTEV
ncbi:MAG: hypothetical protein ACRDHB_04660 [Actinomycetota bacterium]